MLLKIKNNLNKYKKQKIKKQKNKHKKIKGKTNKKMLKISIYSL